MTTSRRRSRKAPRNAQRRLSPLDIAIRQAIRQHYADGDDPEVLEMPADEIIVALVGLAVDIGMTAPPGDARNWFMGYIGTVVAAAENAAEAGTSIGIEMARMHGARLN
jgi:hypothetical protein